MKLPYMELYVILISFTQWMKLPYMELYDIVISFTE